MTDAEIDQILRERDEAQETADNLAHAIAAITGVDIGEHSSMNDPWQNALDAAEKYARPADHGIWATTERSG